MAEAHNESGLTIDPSLLGAPPNYVTAAAATPEIQMGSPKSAEDNAENGSAVAAVEDEEMEDLFGEDADGENEEPKVTSRQEESPTPSLPGSEDISAAERKRRQALEYNEEEDEQEQEVIHLREAAVAVPNLPVTSPSDGNHWIIRLPNFVKVDSKPFEPETYAGPEGDDDPSLGLNLREQSMSIKLQVENTIRWRWTKGQNGEQRKQSNSRIVRWSDGSMSLQLGNEIFDVTSNIDTPTHSSATSISTPSMSSSAPRSQGLTYLVAQHKRAEILQAEAVINGSLTIRPSGMQSATHRKLVRAVGQKHQKATRLMIAPDPTKESELERAEIIKAQKKAAASKRRKHAEDGDVGGKRVGRRASTGGSRRNRQDIWSDDEEGSEEDAQYSRRRTSRTTEPAYPRKSTATEDYEQDEFIVDDEEDDDGGNRKRGRVDAGHDSLDEADEAIERAQQAKRKTKQKPQVDEDDDADEDFEAPTGQRSAIVDSDDEEGAVRRAGGGGARKPRRVVAMEDSDEE